jgi:hypothetical protein
MNIRFKRALNYEEINQTKEAVSAFKIYWISILDSRIKEAEDLLIDFPYNIVSDEFIKEFTAYTETYKERYADAFSTYIEKTEKHFESKGFNKSEVQSIMYDK